MELGPLGQFKQELHAAKKTGDNPLNNPFIVREKTKKVMEAFSGRILGSGSECIVAETERQDFVLAVHHAKMRDPVTNKQLFYAHKILSTLFPKNFPKVYASFLTGQEGLDGIQGTVRQKILQSDLKENKDFEAEKKSDQASAKSFFAGILEHIFPKTELEKNFGQVALAKKTLEKIGIAIRVDDNLTNFIEDRDGNQYYIDTVSKFHAPKSCRPKLEKFLDQQGYSPMEKKVTLGAFDRLIELTQISGSQGNSNDARVEVS